MNLDDHESAEASRPHILLLHRAEVPAEWADDALSLLDAPNLRLQAMGLSAGPYAGAELYLPSAIGLFVAAAYFGGFLSKAGEDHYEALKAASIRLWKRASSIRVTAIGSAGKVSRSQPFSLAYSITGEIVPNLRFKFVLRASFADDEAEVAIVRFLDLIRDIHSGTLEEDTLKALLLHRPVGGTAIVTYDPVSHSIIPVDPRA